ncbi:uncharacterized protein [Prorops nasuta]
MTPGYLVKNKGCRIPEMDPFDPSIKKYIEKEEPIKCENGEQPPLILSNVSAIYVNPAAREYYYNESEKINCCYRNFWRSKDSDEAISFDTECIPFEGSRSINVEFIKIECSRDNKKVYKDYHAFVPRKDAVEKRCSDLKIQKAEEFVQPSILVVGLDSVSRLNFHRMMPKTVKSLRKLGAVEMLGYNKVADNTYPNLVPVLSGMNQDELQKHCWKDKKTPYDNCPFIWKNFSSSGYRTIFGEDACKITTFNYLKPGFKNQPTDYYLRPYCVATENDIGNTHKLNANLCVGTRKTFDNLLDYTSKVANVFSSDLYFAFFWEASLTHDFFTYPQLGDESYSKFVGDLEKGNLLKNTVLIMMSDHGMRWGSFRQTYQGRSEDNLPFVFMVLPDRWKKRYQVAWANLRRNTRSLTTPFDLHETLMDILEPNRLEEHVIRFRSQSMASEKIPRGISWFLSVPDHRTCEMAEIPGHFCMCHEVSDVALSDSGSEESAKFVIEELNKMLRSYPQCAQLSLKTIRSTKAWTGVNNNENKTAPWVDYTVTLQALPGNGIFEGSVRYRSYDKTRKLIGSVSRLNAYGRQSACVDEFNMRLYCYCL